MTWTHDFEGINAYQWAFLGLLDIDISPLSPPYQYLQLKSVVLLSSVHEFFGANFGTTEMCCFVS